MKFELEKYYPIQVNRKPIALDEPRSPEKSCGSEFKQLKPMSRRERNLKSVYEQGRRAAQNGRPRAAAYSLDTPESREFRAAWLKGYDSV